MIPAPLAVCPVSLSRHEGFRAAIAARGVPVRWNPGGRLSGDALQRFLDGAASAVVGLEQPDLAALPALRVVAKYGVGLDGLDLDAAEAAGVRVGWTPGLNRHAVAELTVGLLLALFRGIVAHRPAVRDGALRRGERPAPGRELRGATVGVVGCGHAGLEVVRRLWAFGTEVLVHDARDRSALLPPGAQVGLAELLARADAVTLHLPLTPQTRGLFGADLLAAMRPGAFLVNTARGGLVDERALLAALDRGQLAGAGLDVVQDEPAGPGPLFEHPAVVLTPHIGGSTTSAIDAMADGALRNLLEAAPVQALRARLLAGIIEPG